MKNKIKELIAKYQREHEAEQSIEAWEILADLKSIEKSREELHNIIEIDWKNRDKDELRDTMWDCPNCNENIIYWYKYCPWCWKKIKRINE